MFLGGKIVVAVCATVVCCVPVGMVVFLFVFQRDQTQFLSRVGLGSLVVVAFAIVEIGSQVRRGGFRIGSGISFGWVLVCTALAQACGWLLYQWQVAGALGCGFVGGLIATLVWSREPETKEAGPRSATLRGTAGRHGLAILLALTLVGVAYVIGRALRWL